MATSTTTRRREGKPYPQEQEKKVAVKKSLTSKKGSRKRLREKEEVAFVKKSPPPTTFIPSDIIVEILSWVPAKSLLRLRWACKYWFDLITRDPDFVKLQLHRCSTNTIQHTYSVLIHNSCIGRGANRYSNSQLVQFNLNYYYGNRSTCLSRGRQVGIPHPFGSVAGFKCLGSCNGLLLCTSFDHKKLCIWNPCTQEYRLIPDPPLTKLTGWNVNGFGYDHTIDDYKALRVAYSPASAVQVYTLGTNSWRSIGINPNRFSSLYIGKYANGCLYWIDITYKKIICFDLGKEKYQEESIEHYFDVKFYLMYLQVLEGSLCLVQHIHDHDHDKKDYSLQIWVMKDNGTTNDSITRTSWTQLFTTPISFDRNYHPIQLLRRFSLSGEILLLKDGKELVLYDPKSNTTMNLNGIYREKEYLIVKEVYIESLVSLNSGTYVEQNTQK